jgi:hypothetical protein
MKDKLQKLREMMRTHDWAFMTAEDPRIWKIGRQERRDIHKYVEMLCDEGFEEEAREIWEQRSPMMPMLDRPYPFPLDEGEIRGVIVV